MSLTVDLGRAQTFTEVSLDVGESTGDYLRSYVVQVSDDGAELAVDRARTGSDRRDDHRAAGDDGPLRPDLQRRHARAAGGRSPS